MSDAPPADLPPPPMPGNAAWDRRATLVWMLVVLALTNLPWMWVWRLAPEGQVFTGLLTAPEDTMSYIAKMRLGHEGLWHYVNRYTTEPSQPSLLFMFYIFLGHFARWTGLGFGLLFHLVRLAGSVLLLFSVRRLIRVAGLSGIGAFAAFVLCFSLTGFAWVPRAIIPMQPMEQYISEAYCFLTMMYFPHLTVSTALLVVCLTEFLRLRSGGFRIVPVVLAAACGFLIAWIHPRLLFTAGSVGAVLGMEMWIRDRRFPMAMAAGGVAFAVAGAVPSLLILRSYQGDPILEAWASTPTPSPPVVVALCGYGLLVPLAVLGAWAAWKAGRAGAALPAAWMALGIAACYYPAASQGRMFQGLDIPMALLAGFFLEDTAGAWHARRPPGSSRAATAAVTGLLLLMSLTLAPVLYANISPVFRGTFPWYRSESRQRAMEWLRDNSGRDDVVLCTRMSGQAIPAIAGNRVFAGHWAETHDLAAKEALIAKYFNAATPPDWRAAFIAEHDFRYVFFSPFERALGARAADSPTAGTFYDPAVWEIVHIEPSAASPEVIVLRRKESGPADPDSPARHPEDAP